MKAQKAVRPESMLRSVVSALKHYCVATLSHDPIDDHMNRLIKGLIRAETEKPRDRTNVMPIAPFVTLFSGWKCNNDLSVKDLRQKAVTLLALSALCRPSDLAPPSILKRSQLCFHEKESLSITFFGIKNDYSREGFQVQVKGTNNPAVDPVKCLYTYIERTEYCVSDVGPLFITLIPPFRQITPSVVSQILNKSICDAGLDKKLYTAKCFRPTGASVLFNEGFSSDEVRRLGRWRSNNVMFDHYITAQQSASTALFQSKP